MEGLSLGNSGSGPLSWEEEEESILVRKKYDETLVVER